MAAVVMEMKTMEKEVLRKFVLEKGWMLDEQDEMSIAVCADMSIDEWLTYKEKQRQITKNAYADLRGMHPDAETLYEDYIIRIVGKKFLYLFRRYGYIESCAVINGCKLYALVK